MPNRNKRLGDYAEYRVAELLTRAGMKARRVPLSGAAGGEFSGDLSIDTRHGKIRGEVKRRANERGYYQLTGWLKSNDVLFLYRPAASPLVVLPFHVFAAVFGKPLEESHEQEEE